ncbi:helix-turn-helix transcriptional regulator [Frankia sp. CNm7]|uniref:Helix-turn-helix transcriptional regulator n=1 Tax=Frankia nepalensis TaxID=1836974 RepID=A0A937UQ64_9ACTN|nr:helix-turn-helix transcriptional regulator [Frankia nepalensis]MBL7498156.1 helix-turn-helix transcriptional regulator [Frankia nepalensis]MBL7509326.1 helix-turn-helix transcriptional regulator [Frankia nepalensis]MBL7516886.1 helix-turn-helix transcriptional regulator [Frankia nepalensis]MBL7627945.1 helix-turn-helix transcriptional regulator [Frankia nepalensis]
MGTTDSTPARPHTAHGPADGEEWPAVADALNRRMAARRIGQQELADVSGVSVSTVRAIQRGATHRRVQNATLTALCRALDWPDDHLLRVLLAEPPADAPTTAELTAQILAAVLRIESHVEAIARHFTPA